MSDAPQGPGWWQASDGRFYPPQAPPPYQQPMGSSQQFGAPAPVVVQAPAKSACSKGVVIGILAFNACQITGAGVEDPDERPIVEVAEVDALGATTRETMGHPRPLL